MYIHMFIHIYIHIYIYIYIYICMYVYKCGPRNFLEIVYDGRKMGGVSNFPMEVQESIAHKKSPLS